MNFKNKKIILITTISALVTLGVVLLTVLLIINNSKPSKAWNGVATVLPVGEGTMESPFLISSPANLAYVAQSMDFDDYYYYSLTSDLDMGGYDWVSIGSESNKFIGEFDGNSHTIKNIGEDKKDYYKNKQVSSLFGVTGIADIKNININYAFSSVENVESFGGMVGQVDGYTTIDGCGNLTPNLIFNSTENNDVVGGLVGIVSSKLVLKNSYSLTSISANGNVLVGGLIGEINSSENQEKSIIQSSYFSGKVEALGQVVNSVVGKGYQLNSANNLVELESVYTIYNESGELEKSVNELIELLGENWKIDNTKSEIYPVIVNGGNVDGEFEVEGIGYAFDANLVIDGTVTNVENAGKKCTTELHLNVELLKENQKGEFESLTKAVVTVALGEGLHLFSCQDGRFDVSVNDYSIYWVDENGVEVATGKELSTLTSGEYRCYYVCDFLIKYNGGGKLWYASESYGCNVSIEGSQTFGMYGDYTVEFNANDGETESESQEIVYGKAEKLISNEFYRGGYKFLGWAKSCDGEIVYHDEEKVKNLVKEMGGKITLYAKWQEVECHTITFIAEGKLSGTDSVIANVGEVLPKITKPKKDGYKFKGYFTQKDGQGEMWYNEKGVSTKICELTADITLYGEWEPKTYKATFDNQGGVGGTESVEIVFYDDMPTIEIPTKEGYIFWGYFSDKDGNGYRYITSTGASARTYNFSRNKTFYAYWVKLEDVGQ